jgi:hypothetical protein
MTALMWAAKGKCRRSVERLLDGGANTEIDDKVYHVKSCHVMSCHVMSCNFMWSAESDSHLKLLACTK